MSIEALKNAVEFLDKCRADDKSWETGAMRDAHEWLEQAARDLLMASAGDVECSTTESLLALARQYASECAECDGTGFLTQHSTLDDEGQPCPYCLDIRQVILRACGYKSSDDSESEEYARARSLGDKDIVSECMDSHVQVVRELANRYDVVCEKLENISGATT